MRSNPKNSSIPKLTDKNKGFIIQIKKNSYPQGEIRRYRFISIQELLVDSTKILNLNSNASKVYNSNGNIIYNSSEIVEHEIYYISIGEPFFKGIYTPNKKKIIYKEHEKVDQSLTPNDKQLKSQVSVFTAFLNDLNEEAKRKLKKNLIIEESSLLKFEKNNKYGIELLQKISLAIGYYLFQSKIEDNINEIKENVQYLHFSLFDNYINLSEINNNFSNITIIEMIQDKCIDQFEGLNPNEIKFLITGPSKSGKSSLLYNF